METIKGGVTGWMFQMELTSFFEICFLAFGLKGGGGRKPIAQF